MTRSFDRLARPYALLERLSFGSSLERMRSFCLPWAHSARRALLIGDGDGRFAHSLLSANPDVVVDSLDQSAGMLRRSKLRNERFAGRLRLVRGDVREAPLETGAYDLLALHFVVDCFSEDELEALLPRLLTTLRPGGIVAYSDFRGDRLHHRFVVGALYLAFRGLTGLKAKRLPRVTWPESLRELASTEARGGLLFSTVLREEKGARALSDPPVPPEPLGA